MISYFLESNLIYENQSGFKPGNVCILAITHTISHAISHRVLAITHEICSSFDDNYEVRGALFNFLKAFNKVWHDKIIL